MILLKTFKCKEKLRTVQKEIENSGILTLVKTYDNSNVYKYHLFVQKEKYTEAFKKLQLIDLSKSLEDSESKKSSNSFNLSNIFSLKI